MMIGSLIIGSAKRDRLRYLQWRSVWLRSRDRSSRRPLSFWKYQQGWTICRISCIILDLSFSFNKLLSSSQQRMKCLCIRYLHRKIRHGPNFCLCSARQPLPRITEFQARFNASKNIDEDFLPNVSGGSKLTKAVHRGGRGGSGPAEISK